MKINFCITAIITALIITMFSACRLTDDNWNEDDAIMPYNLIPKPAEHVIYTEYNTKEYCVAKINSMSAEDYDKYIELCMDAGFNLNATSAPDIFVANNAEGFSISLSYDEVFSDCRISVYAPNEN